MFWNRKQSPRPATKSQRTRPRVRSLAFETLEQRENPVSLASGFSIGNAGDGGGDMVRDAAGNTYISGFYTGTEDFDPTHTNPNAVMSSSTYITAGGRTAYNQEGFVAKYDANGVFVWVAPVVRGGYNIAGNLALDQSPSHRGVMVNGNFQGTQTCGSKTLTTVDYQDAYVARLDDATGAVQWVYQTTGTYDWTSGLEVDAAGNVYSASNVFVDWTSYHNVFLTKYTFDGTTVWHKEFGTGNDTQCRNIALDGAGNIVLGGIFVGTIDFNPDPAVTYNLTSGGRAAQPNTAGFVSKLTQSTGAFVWADAFQTGAWSSSDVRNIVVDASNNVYAVGNFDGTVDFNPDKNRNYSVSGTSDSFAVKLDAQGKFVWERTFVGVSSTISLGGASVDSLGNLYLSGGFQGTVDLDPGAGTYYVTSAMNTATNTPYNNIFLTKLTSSGTFVWGATIGGVGDVNGKIVVDSWDNIFVIGSFSGQINFNPDPLGTPSYMTANPGTGLFFIKLTQ